MLGLPARLAEEGMSTWANTLFVVASSYRTGFAKNTDFSNNGCWIAGFFALAAYYLDFGRLFAYGLLFAISELLWGLLGRSIGAMMQTISGIVVLIIGLLVLVRFLCRYSLPVEATLDVKG